MGDERSRVPAVDGPDAAGPAPAVTAPAVTKAVERYLGDADQMLPDRIAALYIVGSTALGAFREGRSDIDFVAVVDGDLSDRDLRRLRLVQMKSGFRTAARAARCRHSPLSGTINGVFIRADDLARPVEDIAPVVSCIGKDLTVGQAGSDVSPVAWKVLHERGITVRGPEPASLGLDPQPELLRAWNLGNLERYWLPWATAVLRSPSGRFRLRPRWSTAWGTLGPPRLHHTIATGEVISKEEAGEYALATFPDHWHPLIREALAYRRLEPPERRIQPHHRARLTARFVLDVAGSAREMMQRTR